MVTPLPAHPFAWQNANPIAFIILKVQTGSEIINCKQSGYSTELQSSIAVPNVHIDIYTVIQINKTKRTKYLKVIKAKRTWRLLLSSSESKSLDLAAMGSIKKTMIKKKSHNPEEKLQY